MADPLTSILFAFSNDTNNTRPHQKLRLYNESELTFQKAQRKKSGKPCSTCGNGWFQYIKDGKFQCDNCHFVCFADELTRSNSSSQQHSPRDNSKPKADSNPVAVHITKLFDDYDKKRKQEEEEEKRIKELQDRIAEAKIAKRGVREKASQGHARPESKLQKISVQTQGNDRRERPRFFTAITPTIDIERPRFLTSLTPRVPNRSRFFSEESASSCNAHTKHIVQGDFDSNRSHPRSTKNDMQQNAASFFPAIRQNATPMGNQSTPNKFSLTPPLVRNPTNIHSNKQNLSNRSNEIPMQGNRFFTPSSASPRQKMQQIGSTNHKELCLPSVKKPCTGKNTTARDKSQGTVRERSVDYKPVIKSNKAPIQATNQELETNQSPHAAEISQPKSASEGKRPPSKLDILEHVIIVQQRLKALRSRRMTRANPINNVMSQLGKILVDHKNQDHPKSRWIKAAKNAVASDLFPAPRYGSLYQFIKKTDLNYFKQGRK